MKNPLQSLSLDSLKKFFAYGERIRPVRDWYVLLSIAVVATLLGLAANAFLFSELQNGKSLGVVIPARQAVGSSVTSVQTVFQKRATDEDNYQNAYHFVDPSAPGS